MKRESNILSTTAPLTETGMTIPEPTVFVVDDDAAICNALQWLIESVNLNVETYTSGHEFLETYVPGRPGCVVLDVRMPEMSGLDVQRELEARSIDLPVIILTGYGDMQTAIRAFKSGAVDFVQKPFNNQNLLDSIQRAVRKNVEVAQQNVFIAEVRQRLDLLSTGESEVLEMILAGNTNSKIAEHLGISKKTVEARRAKLMKKMNAASVVDLTRMVVVLEPWPDEST
jgi:two-component system, LuxR family, response regulator FixJ